MVNNLPPLAGPVDASGEPTQVCIGCGKGGPLVGYTFGHKPGPFCRACWDALKSSVQTLDAEAAAASLPSPCPHCGSRGDCLVGCEYKKFAAAVPSSPAQEPTMGDSDDPRLCGGCGFYKTDCRCASALPPSSPVADPDVEKIVNWHRDMALRFSEDRDIKKHENRKLIEELTAVRAELAALKASSPVADKEQDERREIFIAAIRTLREHCRVEAACTAGHPSYRERQYTFMLKLDEALFIIDASAPSPSAGAAQKTTTEPEQP